MRINTHTHPGPPARAPAARAFFAPARGRLQKRRATRERQMDAELLISLILRCSAFLRGSAEFSRGMGTGTQSHAGTAEGRRTFNFFNSCGVLLFCEVLRNFPGGWERERRTARERQMDAGT